MHDHLRNGKVPVCLKQDGGEDEARNSCGALLAGGHYNFSEADFLKRTTSTNAGIPILCFFGDLHITTRHRTEGRHVASFTAVPRVAAAEDNIRQHSRICPSFTIQCPAARTLCRRREPPELRFGFHAVLSYTRVCFSAGMGEACRFPHRVPDMETRLAAILC